MKVNGTHLVRADRNDVWDALQDPEMLVRTIPGCQRLEAVGPDSYSARVAAGVASITGVYDGRVTLEDQDAPNAYTLRAEGRGGPGTINAIARVQLSDTDGGTRVDYEADAVVGGPIAGVGQRVLAGAAKRNATVFFESVDRYLTAPPVEVEIARASEERVPEVALGRRVYTAPPAPARPPSPLMLLAAAAAGAAIALAGVLIGRRTSR